MKPKVSYFVLLLLLAGCAPQAAQTDQNRAPVTASANASSQRLFLLPVCTTDVVGNPFVLRLPYVNEVGTCVQTLMLTAGQGTLSVFIEKEWITIE